jgi:hypothetical protein
MLFHGERELVKVLKGPDIAWLDPIFIKGLFIEWNRGVDLFNQVPESFFL